MFTTVTLPLGARWAIRGRTWVVAQRDQSDGEGRYRIHLIDPASGLQATGGMPKANGLVELSPLYPQTHNVKLAPTLDGWSGYEPDEFVVRDRITLAGQQFIIHAVSIEDHTVELDLQTSRLRYLSDRATAARRRGDHEQFHRTWDRFLETWPTDQAWLHLPCAP